MHIGVQQEVAPLLRLQTVGPTTYVTALAPFARSRVIAEDRSTGAVILLDLSAAAENTSTQPITVVAAPNGDAAITAQPLDAEQVPVDMVTLTRFAAQQMYAPRRLAVTHLGIRRVMLDAAPLRELYAGAGLKATPAGQWRGGEFYVTAVVLQNLQSQAIELNPADVRGHWRAITFQHGRLLARGSESDTTVAYLVCERPFNSCR
jgi:integrating conjugative element protein (TIGR03749 family)